MEFSRRGFPWSAPTRAEWFAGLNIDDQDKAVFTRPETVIAFETGSGNLNGIRYELGQTAAEVRGVASNNQPPYAHKLSGFRHAPRIALLSAAQFGNNTMLYWPVLYSQSAVSRHELRVALDSGTSRMISTPAPVAYTLFEHPFVLRP